jgi:F-type H+-transporting ATPase subunit alpha
MPAAEKAVRDAANDISEALVERLESSKKLNEQDKSTILKLAQHALKPFSVESSVAETSSDFSESS